jgi:hypothetical protein
MGGDMVKAIDLLRQGRHEEIWQMCCGYLKYDINQFMSVQKRLLLGQIEVLNKSKIGKKIFNGAIVETVEDFRNEVPLTTYSSYCPELSEKMEDALPEKPGSWVHTSGRSGEYSCKWVPFTSSFENQLSSIIYGLGMLSASKKWGDITPLIECPNMMYTVAPRPYMSGALASMLEQQTPSNYFPSLQEAETLPFEERVRMGFDRALDDGLDYFFGLSVVLTAVGERFNQSTGSAKVLPLLLRPKAMARLTKGMIKSRIAGRPMLPKDLWNLKGIITSGLDSSVYKNKIKEFWNRYPLDIYSNTEGGVIATQTWDYNGMTFIPNLNFLEFIPEKEHAKWQIDHKYQAKTVLLDEVKSGECYEIVITNFHGGSLVRYRVGDMIRIISLDNEESGINLPQMVFERRADDLLDFATIRLTEKTVWKAIEGAGLHYQDWVAFKRPGELTMNLLIEPNKGEEIVEAELEKTLYNLIIKEELNAFASSKTHQDAIKTTKLDIKVTLLPVGSFANYTARMRSEGADLAHLKPPHVNPPQKVLTCLLDPVPVQPKPAIPPVPVVKRVVFG